MLDDLIVSYDWSREEADYADQVVAQCIEVATFDLLEVVSRRITHKRKLERRTKLLIGDIRLAAVLAYVMNVHNAVCDQLIDTFEDKQGAMYFST